GWILPMGSEYGMATPFWHARAEDFAAAQEEDGLLEPIREINRQAGLLADGEDRTLRRLRAGATGAVALRNSDASPGHLVVVNRDSEDEFSVPVATDVARFGLTPARPDSPTQRIPPASGLVVPLAPAAPVLSQPPGSPRAADVGRERIAIETVAPSVEEGRFAAKALAGEAVVVTADII